jgi:hypothetical protein
MCAITKGDLVMNDKPCQYHKTCRFYNDLVCCDKYYHRTGKTGCPSSVKDCARREKREQNRRTDRLFIGYYKRGS